MPEPAAFGATRRVTHTHAAVVIGIQSSGNHQAKLAMRRKPVSATSVSQVKPTIDRPASAAKAITSARVIQGRQSVNSRRSARTASWSVFMAATGRTARISWRARAHLDDIAVAGTRRRISQRRAAVLAADLVTGGERRVGETEHLERRDVRVVVPDAVLQDAACRRLHAGAAAANT